MSTVISNPVMFLSEEDCGHSPLLEVPLKEESPPAPPSPTPSISSRPPRLGGSHHRHLQVQVPQKLRIPHCLQRELQEFPSTSPTSEEGPFSAASTMSSTAAGSPCLKEARSFGRPPLLRQLQLPPQQAPPQEQQTQQTQQTQQAAAAVPDSDHLRWNDFETGPASFPSVLLRSDQAAMSLWDDGESSVASCSTPGIQFDRTVTAPETGDRGVVSASKFASQMGPRSSLRQRRSLRLRLNLTLDKEDAQISPLGKHAGSNRLHRYTLMESLGQGSCGTVYRGQVKASGVTVALKFMRMDDEELLMSAQREFELLKTLHHPNIVQAIDFFQYPMGVVLVMDFIDGMPLDTVVRESPAGKLQETTAVVLFSQLLATISYLHSSGVVHRDIKGENCLVSTDLLRLKLIDFNTAEQVIEGGLLSMAGTADYMAPEVLLAGQGCALVADIWAAGICLHIMLMGKLPAERNHFASHEDFGMYMMSYGETIEASAQAAGLSEDARHTLMSCLQARPDSRPTADEILASSWLMQSAL